MSYHIKCSICENEYLLQDKPAIDMRIKCCICKNIWAVKESDITQCNTEEMLKPKQPRHLRTLIMLLGLFIAGGIVTYITYIKANFMVLNAQMITKQEERYITCNILNRTRARKKISAVKLNFADQSMEYKVQKTVEPNGVYTFEVKVYPENAVMPKIEVKE